MWAPKSDLEDQGIEKSLAEARVCLRTTGPGPRAFGFQGRCLQHTKDRWPALGLAVPGWQESRALSGGSNILLPVLMLRICPPGRQEHGPQLGSKLVATVDMLNLEESPHLRPGFEFLQVGWEGKLRKRA